MKINIKQSLKGSYKELVDIIFPIGSLFITESSQSPANTIGGSWVEVKSCLIAAHGKLAENYYGYSDSIGSIQGSYYITTDNMPSHHHAFHHPGYSWNEFNYSPAPNPTEIVRAKEGYGHKVFYSNTSNMGGGTLFPDVSLLLCLEKSILTSLMVVM